MIATLPPTVAVASPPPARSAKAKPARVADRPDRVSAMVTARVQKSRVEDLSARTPTTATFANPDGTWTTESYAGVVRSKADADAWVSVDPALESAHGRFQPRATPFEASYSAGGDGAVGYVAAPQGTKIEVGWPAKLPAPQVDGSELTYAGVASGADLVVASHTDGFNYSVILNHAPAAGAAPVEYRFPLHFAGGTPEVKSDGSIVVKAGKRQVATLSAPVMWDSSTRTDGNGAATAIDRRPVNVTVEGTGDSRTLVLRPDMRFLQDPNTVYPVTVDPTVNISVGGDTWVDSLLNQSSQYNSPELQVGSNNLGLTKARSFMYFDWTPLYSMAPGVLTSAQVQLSNFQTGACAGTAIRMSRITSGWTLGGLTWGNQPAVTAAGSSTSTGSFGASGCTGEGVVTFDATAIASEWFNNNAPLYGVQFKADNEGAASGYRKFRSVENGDPSKAPKMIFTYNAYPATPTGLTISPGYNGYASSLTPTLSAVVADPDGGAVRGYFEVKSGSTVVWSGSSAMATSGDRVSVTVPSGVLTDGITYTVSAYSQDSALISQKPLTRSVPVDVTAPGVAITSSGFTDGIWQTTPPSSATFTFQGPADTNNFLTAFDGVPLWSVRADSSGKFVSDPWTPTPGWHTWTITPVDRAGNIGAPTDFSFGVGAGGFVTPNTWTETTSSFPVQMTAPPNSTGATLQWQVYGETIWHTATQLTSGGSAWSGSVTTTNGHSATPALVWKATDEPFGSGTLTAPKLVVIKGCFHYASAADSCTATNPIILTTSARGGNFPEANLGPASVALYTGEATISDTDAADSKAGIGRTFSSFSDATLTPGVFGPGWSEPSVLTAPSPDAKAQVIDNRTKDGTFAIVDPDSGSQVFTAKQGSTTDYVPLHPTGDATALTFTAGTNGDPDKLALSRPLGSGSVTTTWTLKPSDTGGSPEWTVDQVNAPGGTTNDVAVTSAPGSQRPVWIRESDPGVAATCNATTQTTGCRGLQITYTGTGAATRVSSVSRVIGADTQAGVVTKTLATYTYDGSGQLSSVCSAAPAAGKPPLCVGYTYTTVAGRTLLAQITPPGLKPWRFTYDSIARLNTVKREKPTGGDAVWSADYNLSVTASGLPNLTASNAAQWGQTVVPTKVFAVYEPYTGTADVSHAQLYYTTTNGAVTNTATYGPSGWLVDTNWYDAKGNAVRHLDGTGWARVQAAAAADRARVADEASSYTVYNAWGDADTVGTHAVDEYGPAHTASLKSGVIGMFRTHTHTVYDDDPNVDPAMISGRPGSQGLGLVVAQNTSASDVSRTTDYDTRVVKYGYDPIVAGDGSGWTLGKATTVSVQVDATSWLTQTTRYDASGRRIEKREPGAAVDSSGAGTDARSTETTYYSATGSGDCGGKPAWEGLPCKVSPAGQPSGQPIPTTYVAAYDDDLQATEIQDISGGVVTRTTSNTYDALGRTTAVTTSTVGSGVANETIAVTDDFDNTSGLPTSVRSNGLSVMAAYDTWGRPITYTDASGSVSTTTYDDAGNEATFSDGSGTYNYTYDSHNSLISADAGGGVGTFRYAYSPNGILDSVTYPNGVVAKRTYDEVGTPIGLAYSQGSGTKLLAFTATNVVDGRIVAKADDASSQRFAFDGAGRLTKTEDTDSSGCTTRLYGFDSSSNRQTFTSFAPGSDGTCQTGTAQSTRSFAHDAADRLSNTGYSYDTLGRTIATPGTDTGADAASALSASYHADDMVAGLSQSVRKPDGSTKAVALTYGLDPAERVNSITTTTDGVETKRLRYHFGRADDSPTAIDTSTDAGTTWSTTRFVTAPSLGLAASVDSGAITLQLVDLKGNVVATMPAGTGSTITAYTGTDEFGNPAGASAAPRYGWLGAEYRSTDAIGGFMLMGARLYNPSTGGFLTRDPIPGANLTPYTYPQDPINVGDPSGMDPGGGNGGLPKCSCPGYSKPTGDVIFGDRSGWRSIQRGSNWMWKVVEAAEDIFSGMAIGRLIKKSIWLGAVIGGFSVGDYYLRTRQVYEIWKSCYKSPGDRQNRWHWDPVHIGEVWQVKFTVHYLHSFQHTYTSDWHGPYSSRI